MLEKKQTKLFVIAKLRLLIGETANIYNIYLTYKYYNADNISGLNKTLIKTATDGLTLQLLIILKATDFMYL